MLFDPSNEIKTALSYARQFSLEKELFYIDSQMILLGLLDSFTNTLEIEDPEREKIITWLQTLDWERSIILNILTSIPITLEAERMLKNAAYYQKKLKDEYLQPSHIMLSLLSIDNLCRVKLETLGITFHTYLLQLEASRDQELRVPFRSPRIKSSRSFPYIRRFYKARKRITLAKKHLAEARDFLQYYDRKSCRRLCRYILQLDPTHTEGLWLMGVAWAADRHFEKAIPFYEKVLRKHPQHIGVLSQLGNCYSQTGDKNRAIELYLRALSVNPSSPELLNDLGFVLIDLQQYDRAITLFDQAIAIDGQHSNAYSNKGYVLMRLGYFSQARELFIEALEMNKGNAYAYRNFALLYLQERNLPAAKEMLLKAKLYDFKSKYGNEVDGLLHSLDNL
jgi:tetratricopeptide (TPR) repeat protein